MEYIRKSIYTLPEIRHSLVPLWSAWVLAAMGAACGVCFFLFPENGAGVTSALLGGVIVGACSLVLVLCYYLFGDSRRPYSRELHALLEPTYTYYASEQKDVVVAALEAHDEASLEAIKRQVTPDLALVRYSDRSERIFYSQLTRVEGKKYIPLTEIIIKKA
ncbi:MAG: hypothetical protein IJ745_08195 [Bacteroidales bacterium]|nr:hypothetical protein [Bacteroidales bacterium]